MAWRPPKKKVEINEFEAYHLQLTTMPILCFSKRSQGLNELETQILKRQNKGKAFVQKVVQPLADEIPPAAHLILLLLNSFLIPLLLLNALLYSYVIPIDLNYALLFKYILLF